ncbi:Ser/Thr phosphatase family protein [Mycolicibacterium canariasense]|uniref:Ser/Thr phosphatase family protein n=1 Tax=Mycolicibacterium canariasense TaxID=228230 RepID=A0A117I8W6_MYCCR|nr:hypothetical protein [Mycolicibacterium canariasense]MCV7212857.1 hypothetical protein [Mycolicibacterium canariasense]ORV19261.1 hypothetical protein AWB94_32380 [Mycolicibacterium canariasense]GAS93829.1 Ser/Thr phosphatase family protein [Mycolicibacterium canariasense]
MTDTGADLGGRLPLIDPHTLSGEREDLRLAHADDIQMFCNHDQSEYLSWTDDRGQPDVLIRYQE